VFDLIGGSLNVKEMSRTVAGRKVTSRRTGKPVNKVPTVVLYSGTAKSPGTLTVAASAGPYPLQFTDSVLATPVSPAVTGRMTFTRWNAKVTLVPPPADKVVDVT
jgi:hypothetical protein